MSCLAISGSTSASTRSRPSKRATVVPKSWKICAISMPMAPPPTMARRPGRPGRFQMVSEVSTPPVCRPSRAPGMGGTKGGAPVAMTAAPKVMRSPWEPSPGSGRVKGSSMLREVSTNTRWSVSKEAKPWMSLMRTPLSVLAAISPRVVRTLRRVS